MMSGCRADDLGAVRDDAVLGQAAGGALREDIRAAGQPDQFRDPGDAADHRFVPLLEVHPWVARQRAGRFPHPRQSLLQRARIALGLFGRPDQRAEAPHVTENALDRAVIADPHFDAVRDQIAGDVGLQIRESDGQVGPERQYLGGLGAGKRRNARLLAPRLGRPHGKA